MRVDLFFVCKRTFNSYFAFIRSFSRFSFLAALLPSSCGYSSADLPIGPVFRLFVHLSRSASQTFLPVHRSESSIRDPSGATSPLRPLPDRPFGIPSIRTSVSIVLSSQRTDRQPNLSAILRHMISSRDIRGISPVIFGTAAATNCNRHRPLHSKPQADGHPHPPPPGSAQASVWLPSS